MVTQIVECLTENQMVVGANPACGTMRKIAKIFYYNAHFFDIQKIWHYNINVPQKGNANLFLDNHIVKYNTLTTRCRRLV